MGIEKYMTNGMREEFCNFREEEIEEIRVRNGRPVEWITADKSVFGRRVIGDDDMEELINYLTEYSWYAMEEQFKQGFFTLEGGHRVGIVGKAEYSSAGLNGTNITCVSDIGAVNIRVAHEKKGCAKSIVPVIRNGRGIFHTLIVSPPGIGKTTYLRDCIRILSGGYDGMKGMKVGVVDERSEIGACYRGVPQNDLGPRTDVMDNCPKIKGMKMLLRSMSPQVIAVDELGGEEDFNAVEEIIRSGSCVLGTIHATGLSEVLDKINKYSKHDPRLIQRFIFLQKNESIRTYHIYDGTGKMIC